MKNIMKIAPGVALGIALIMSGCSVPSDTVSEVDQAIEEASKPTNKKDKPKPEKVDPVEAALAKMSVSQQNAVDSALSYLDMSGYSRAGLIDQLSSEYGEGYPLKDAQAAVTFLETHKAVNWNAEAVQSAESYLDMSGYSRQGLIDQLSSEYGEEFTVEQATYAANQVGL